MPRILGIDSSLSSTGLCRVDVQHAPPILGVDHVNGVTWSGQCATVGAPKPGKDKSHRAKSRRITTMMGDIEAAMMEDPRVDLVALEGLAYAAAGSTAVLSWVWGRIVDLCETTDTALVVIAPSAIKKYATGKGNAHKDVVLLAAQKRWPHVGITGNDTADATVAAAMGCRHLGLPIDTVPKLNQEAMEKVHP